MLTSPLQAPSSQLPAAPHRSPQPPNTHTSRGRSGGGDEALRVSGRARHGTAPRPQRAHCTRPPPGPISAGALAPSRSAPVTPRQKVSPVPPLSTPSSVKGGHSGIVITVSTQGVRQALYSVQGLSLLPSLALQELQRRVLVYGDTPCFSQMGVKELALSIPTDGDALWGPRETLFLNPQRGAFPLWRLTRKSPTVAFAFCLFKFLRFPT